MIRFILIQLIYIITMFNYLDNNNFVYLMLLIFSPIQFFIFGWLFKIMK